MRDVPYFPCYASNLIANKHYRMMTLLERGLWITMYLECWPNISLPRNEGDLSKYLGLSQVDVNSALTLNLMSFFEVRGDELVNPELEAYRKQVLQDRLRKKEGGKEGARRKKLKQSIENQAMESLRCPEAPPKGVPEGALDYVNSDQFKLNQFNSNQLLDKDSIESDSEWIAEYEATDNLSYLEQSKGI